MTVFFPAFLRIYDSTSTVFAVQNFYQQGNITVSGEDYQFLPFSTSELPATLSADQATVTLTMPAINAASLALEGALSDGWLAQLTVYRFEADAAPDAPPSSQTTLITLTGEVTGGALPSASTLTLELGSALAPLGAQVPPRVFSPSLVGIPCRL